MVIHISKSPPREHIFANIRDYYVELKLSVSKTDVVDDAARHYDSNIPLQPITFFGIIFFEEKT